ncbi:MAG: hypothetical protein HKN87_06245 [Saprospiraceae bacterium]|nr:hypothetical protein [Saprospiraceae bacterium]
MSIQKQFLPNIVLVVGLNLLIKPFYILGIDRGVQNEVGAEAYGVYFALLNFVYLFQFFNDLGIQNFHHSVYSKFEYLIPKYLPKIIGAKVMLAMLFLLVTLAGTALLGYPYVYLDLIGMLALNQVLASLVLFFRTALSARGHYQLDSLLSILDKLVMILLVGYLLWFASAFDMTIRTFVYCQMLSFTVAVSVAFWMLRRRGIISLSTINIDLSYTKWLLKKSLPYALVLLLMLLYTRMDGVMIERLLPDGQEQAGIYAASYRILDAFNMLGLLFAGLLLPMFAKLIAQQESIETLASMAGSMLWTISTTVVVISIFWADELIFLLYKSATPYWSKVYQLLIGSFIAVSLGYVYGTLLTAGEQIQAMNRFFFIGVLLNFFLNLVFIHYWKAMGAALATLITQSLTTAALIWLAYIRYQFKLNWWRIGKSMLFVLILIMSIWGVLAFQISWKYQVLISAGCAFLLARFMGLVPSFVLLRGLSMGRIPKDAG